MKGPPDLNRFWLRKSKQPVLSILLVRTPHSSQGYKTYRGINMEVSMPTGSLCAERNAIGSALADNIGLSRSDFVLIAVLSVSPPPKEGYPPVFKEEVQHLRQEGEEKGEHGTSSSTTFSSSSATTADAFLPQENVSRYQRTRKHKGSPDLASQRRSSNQSDQEEFSDREDEAVEGSSGMPPSPHRVRKIKTPMSGSSFSLPPNAKQGHSMRRQTSNGTVSSVSSYWYTGEGDLNPLLPCGSCNEWLKKIGFGFSSFVIFFICLFDSTARSTRSLRS